MLAKSTIEHSARCRVIVRTRDYAKRLFNVNILVNLLALVHAYIKETNI